VWPRGFELLLGVWMTASPWIFGHAEMTPRMWAEIGAGMAVILFSLVSFLRSFSWAHYLTGIAGVWMIGFGYFGSPRPGPPAAQNEIIAGLFLLMLFFLPNEVSLPPKSWRTLLGIDHPS
jgi:hypothetical protein